MLLFCCGFAWVVWVCGLGGVGDGGAGCRLFCGVGCRNVYLGPVVVGFGWVV